MQTSNFAFNLAYIINFAACGLNPSRASFPVGPNDYNSFRFIEEGGAIILEHSTMKMLDNPSKPKTEKIVLKGEVFLEEVRAFEKALASAPVAKTKKGATAAAAALPVMLVSEKAYRPMPPRGLFYMIQGACNVQQTNPAEFKDRVENELDRLFGAPGKGESWSNIWKSGREGHDLNVFETNNQAVLGIATAIAGVFPEENIQTWIASLRGHIKLNF